MRPIILLAAAVLGFGAAPAVADGVTPQAMTARHEDGAKRTEGLAPRGAARAIQFDVGWAASPDEARTLGHNAVVLLSAMAQDCNELPLRRVYVVAGKRTIPLQRLSSETVPVAEDSLAYRMHGRCREDSFYLAPAGALLRDGEMFADFAVNRTGFRVSELPLSPPDFVRKSLAKAKPAKPAAEALAAFLEREYPGFSRTKTAP